jgi:hypothetical protein
VEASETRNTGRVFFGYAERDHYGGVDADKISETGREDPNLG